MGHKLNFIGDVRSDFLGKSNLTLSKGDVLFFTEEKSLKHFYSEQEDYYFLPKEMDLDILDDKYKFNIAIDAIGERTIYSRLVTECNENNILFPILLKPRFSWKGSIKMPKAEVVSNYSDLTLKLSNLSLGVIPDDFLLQKLINITPTDNKSISGYYSYKTEFSHLIATERLLSADLADKTTAAAVRTVKDEWGLFARTQNILKKIKFEGVFELEFLFDCESNEFYVLELNPRFWMQHGIFINHFDNCLIKYYLGLDQNEGYQQIFSTKKVLWVDTICLFKKERVVHLIKLICSHFYFGYSIQLSPNIFFFFKYLLKLKLRRHKVCD